MKRILILLLSFILISPVVSALKPGDYLMSQDNLVRVTYPCLIKNNTDIYISLDAPQGNQYCDISYNKYVSDSGGGSHGREDIPVDYNSTLPWWMGGSRNLTVIQTTTTQAPTTTIMQEIHTESTSPPETPTTQPQITTIPESTTTTTLEVVTEKIPVTVEGPSTTTILLAVLICLVNVLAIVSYFVWKQIKNKKAAEAQYYQFHSKSRI
jgi:hypothetical protein